MVAAQGRFGPPALVNPCNAYEGDYSDGSILHFGREAAGGPICGHFRIDAGDNKRADSLSTLLGQATDAAEVIRTIRQEYPQCVNVVSANILILEKEEAFPHLLAPKP
jgi:hypothetical protein